MFLAKRKIQFANLYLDTRWSFSPWVGKILRWLAVYFRWRYCLCYYSISIRLVFKFTLVARNLIGWSVILKSLRCLWFLKCKGHKIYWQLWTYGRTDGDQVIYDNADKIGGDRNRITIDGESAGSISFSSRMLTPEISQYVNQGWFYQNFTLY